MSSGRDDASPRWREALISALPERTTIDAPLGPRVAFRIGGPADALVKPHTTEELKTALTIARDLGAPVTVLGTGSNVLVGDGGVRGIVLRLAGELADTHVGFSDDQLAHLEVGAGALNAPLVALLLNLGLVDLEFLATIPGTFGGALIMNAGAHGGEIGPAIREVTLLDAQLAIVVRAGADCGFAYRTSAFGPGEILTKAILEVRRGDAIKARAHLDEMRKKRKASQPLDLPNAGSIFKNPPGDHAGRLIEAAGLKGRTIGRAQISELHANFIVNLGGARAADVVALADLAAQSVEERFGVRLEWEVKRIGEHVAEGFRTQ
jgi:UDP-N-acetylmuramate dehydrogenase